MIRFGPSGNDEQFYADGFKSTVDAPAWLGKMGLTALELNFGRGVRLKTETAAAIGAEARKHNIAISCHAPYYINLASEDAAIVKKSYEYIASCIRALDAVNASDGKKRIVIHVGSQKDLAREDAIANCKRNLKAVVDKLYKDGFSDFLLCIETMGRYRAIGNLVEICDICSVDACVVPTIDFGHVNAIEQGELQRNPERMRDIIEYTIAKIGDKPFHIHFHPTIYHQNGEHMHTHLDDAKWAFPFEPLARVLKEKNLEPTVISESQNQMARDALKMAKVYKNV